MDAFGGKAILVFLAPRFPPSDNSSPGLSLPKIYGISLIPIFGYSTYGLEQVYSKQCTGPVVPQSPLCKYSLLHHSHDETGPAKNRDQLPVIFVTLTLTKSFFAYQTPLFITHPVLSGLLYCKDYTQVLVGVSWQKWDHLKGSPPIESQLWEVYRI